LLKLVQRYPYLAATLPFTAIVLLNLALGNWFWAAVDAAAGVGGLFYLRHIIRRIRGVDP